MNEQMQTTTPMPEATPVMQTPAAEMQEVQPAPQASAPMSQAPAGAGTMYASFGQRLVAAILDGIILSFAQNILLMLLNLGERPLIMFAISMTLTGLYAGYFLSTTGQTLGKKVMKIKVVKKGTNELLSVQDALLRDVIGKFVSSIILFIGYLMVLWDKDKQALHDKFVNSVVIKMN